MPHSSTEVDIPYRCPKCGSGEHGDLKFPSLRALREHLESEHSYLTSPKSTSNGHRSPLTDCFNREAKELERQLKLAKEAEIRHRQLWTKLVEPDHSALENIERELRQSAKHKEELNEALGDAVGTIVQMRKNAEMMSEDQKDTVRKLHDQLSLKEADLDILKSQLRALAAERDQYERDKKNYAMNSNQKEGLIQLLRNEIADKEAEINNRQREVDEMSQFLKDTAQKETLARRKLEDFIEGLVDRAENAEQSVNQMQRYMAMSQDGLPSMGINSPISSMPPMESVPRSSLPMGPRRQMAAPELSWSTNDILNSDRPNMTHPPPMSVLNRSHSADPLVPGQEVLSNVLPSLSSAPKGFLGDKTSDYGSLSSYAVTSPKSQPSVNGVLEREYPAGVSHNVADDVINEEPIIPLKKENFPRGYVPQAGASAPGHIAGSQGNGLDVDEHGIMWDTEVQTAPPGDSQGDLPGASPHVPDGYGPHVIKRPLHRADSNVSSQQSIVDEINRNTEKILSQQREMLSNQLSFLAKQQQFLNRGFAELKAQHRKSSHSDSESETETTTTEHSLTVNSETSEEEQTEEEEETPIEEDSSVFEEDHAGHPTLNGHVDPSQDEESEGSVIEYQPQSSLPPGVDLHEHTAKLAKQKRKKLMPLMPSPLHYNPDKHKRDTPKKMRGRFIAPGYKSSDIKKMVTTTIWAVPTASPQPAVSPLNALPRPDVISPKSPHPHHQKPQHLPGCMRAAGINRDLEALFCVFMYLDVFSLARAAQVCKSWYKLTHVPALWRRVTLKNAVVSSKCLNHIAKFSVELQHLRLIGLRARARYHNEDIVSYRRKTRGTLEEGLESVMRVSGGALKTLEVIDCGNLLTDRCLWLASCYSRNITDVTYISDIDPVGSEVIWSLGAGCRQITKLVIPPMFPNQNPHKFTNHCAFNIARCWPDLQTLSLGGVDVTARGLAAIAHFCSKLQHLELDHMCEVTEEMAITICKAGLKGLRSLHLTFTPVTPKALLHFTSACPHLNDITVRVGISDYYEDTENPQHREEFATIISKLRKLQHRPGFEQKLHLNVDYGPQKLSIPATPKFTHY